MGITVSPQKMDHLKKAASNKEEAKEITVPPPKFLSPMTCYCLKTCDQNDVENRYGLWFHMSELASILDVPDSQTKTPKRSLW